MDSTSKDVRSCKGKAAFFLGKMVARLAYLQAQKIRGQVFDLSYSPGITFSLRYSKLKRTY